MTNLVETPMTPVKLDKLCDHCQHGLMNFTGQVSGDKFIHVCPECRFSELHDVRYPYVTFKETAQ